MNKEIYGKQSFKDARYIFHGSVCTYRNPYEVTMFPSKRIINNYNLHMIVLVPKILNGLW